MSPTITYIQYTMGVCVCVCTVLSCGRGVYTVFVWVQVSALFLLELVTIQCFNQEEINKPRNEYWSLSIDLLWQDCDCSYSSRGLSLVRVSRGFFTQTVECESQIATLCLTDCSVIAAWHSWPTHVYINHRLDPSVYDWVALPAYTTEKNVKVTGCGIKTT